MYRYIGTENLVVTGDGDLYALAIESPIDYGTYEEAEKDRTGYRLEKKEGEIWLVVYPAEWSITDTLADGRKVLRPVTAGEPVAQYTCSEFLKRPCNAIFRYVSEEDRDFDEVYEEGFYSSDLTFDEMFPELEDGERIYISKSKSSYVIEVGD